MGVTLRGAKTPILTSQLQVQEIFVHVESDGSLPAANEGYGEVTITKNGTGDYTITLANPAERIVCPRHPVPEGVAGLSVKLSSASASAVRYVFDNDGTDTDTEFWVGIVISDDLVVRPV